MELFSWDAEQFRFLIHVAVAMLLGGVVGADREITGKSAGLRTHMLVAGASSLFVSTGMMVIQAFESGVPTEALRGDPIRIVHGVITGISFLGAGTIIARPQDDRVKGLTTAASIWFVAAIGVCVALSQIILAIGATILVLIALRCLRSVEEWLRQRYERIYAPWRRDRESTTE
ncbi:MAG: methyltransferase [Candidatus Poribacteria bacterium]|nr:MAG: methyltransferase [Candidatus Poribacteria bacterium]